MLASRPGNLIVAERRSRHEVDVATKVCVQEVVTWIDVATWAAVWEVATRKRCRDIGWSSRRSRPGSGVVT